MRVFLSTAALLLSCIATPAHAEWEFRAVPYIWMSGLDGEASAVADLPPAEVDASFGDVLENLDFAIFGAVEARNAGFFLRGDVAYASLTGGADTPGTAFSDVSLNTEVFNIAAYAGAVVYEEGDLRMDVFAGGRIWDISNDIDFGAGTLPARTVRGGANFFDPMVGASARFPIAKGVSGMVQGAVGGFGVGADSEYDLQANLFFNLNDNWGIAGGYRYLAVDYDNDDGFVYDMAQHGPYLGVFFDF